MSDKNMLRLIGELKGAPLSIIFVMLFLNRCVTELELIRYTRYSKATIWGALKLLCDPVYGLVLRVQGGWVLARNEQGLLSWVADDSEKVQNLNLFSTTTIKESINNDNNDINSNTKKGLKIKPFANIPEDKQPICQALLKAGIFQNNRTAALVEMPHITPEYIAAKKLEYPARKDVGFLIQALEAGEPIAEKAPLEKVSFTNSCFSEILDDDEEPEDDNKFSTAKARYAELEAMLSLPETTDTEREAILYRMGAIKTWK